MQPLHPHGASKRLLSLLGDGITIDLIGYADGTFGIDRDGLSIGSWPASEECDCVKVFYELGEFGDASPCVVLSRAAYQAVTAAVVARANLN